MGNNITLGGERLGGGKRNKVQLKSYERSTHDKGYIWRSTMSSGTLVPFMSELVLPGDTFDINLEADVLTHPTIGPLFGTYKLHLDIFLCPIRLYNSMLHMNMLGIGMDMSKVYLPLVRIPANVPVFNKPIDNQQMSPSCIFKYLGISGNGWQATSPVEREFNAVPWLAYWDIYKNYYANKQEGVGAVVHTKPQPNAPTCTNCTIYNTGDGNVSINVYPTAAAYVNRTFNDDTYIVFTFTAAQLTADFQLNQLQMWQQIGGINFGVDPQKWFQNWTIDVANNVVIGENAIVSGANVGQAKILVPTNNYNAAPKVTTFPLVNIDTMRTQILQASQAAAFKIYRTMPNALSPYNLVSEEYQTAVGPPIIRNYSTMFAQEGLALRTYQSDLFNNWIDTNTIDGANGITAVTSVNVVANKFTIDELNLSKKVYDMLNRIAVSGGSYDDWLDAVYTHERTRSAENPIYMGGMLKNIVFQEVISQSATEGEPLGTLAGRGKLGGIHKGGRVTAKVDEPGYLIGIVSIVPNIDYSQGNQWDVNLKTLNDLHKPALDEIGFQNLVTDQMAWYDTLVLTQSTVGFRSAGKQPAWINYMTSVNKVYGNFADETQQMYMVLNRRYESTVSAGQTRISDLTTYIDPTKFNHIFADTRLDAMNFWVQIGVQSEARRKMSAKVIPNL